jgi:hypothetical protein
VEIAGGDALTTTDERINQGDGGESLEVVRWEYDHVDENAIEFAVAEDLASWLGQARAVQLLS